MADVQVYGLEELGRRVDQFAQDLQRKMIRKATGAGVEVFRRQIRTNAPVRVEVGKTGFRKTAKGKAAREPGYLKRHIGRWSKARGDDGFSMFVGPTRSAFYSRFYELGTSHQRKRPFVRPAFDSKQSEAERVFADTLNQQIVENLR